MTAFTAGRNLNFVGPGMARSGDEAFPWSAQYVWAASQRPLPEEQRQDYLVWPSEKIRRVSPLGRWQLPEEIAAMAVFLVPDHAKNITGQTLNIDGGQVMHA